LASEPVGEAPACRGLVRMVLLVRLRHLRAEGGPEEVRNLMEVGEAFRSFPQVLSD
jgi:hypothetical protein